MATGETCEPNEECKYFPDCFESTHHLFYPERDYRTPLERLFRSLDENKVELCRSKHDQLHAEQDPPLRPTREEMLQALSGSMIYISCTKRKQIYGE